LEEEGDDVFGKADFSLKSNLVVGVGGSISLNQCDGRSSIIIFVLDCKSCMEIRLSIDSRVLLLIGPTKFNVYLSGSAVSSSKIGEIKAWRLSKETDLGSMFFHPGIGSLLKAILTSNFAFVRSVSIV